MTCTCFYCKQGKEHPERHKQFRRISDHLIVAESLNPEHSIPMECCVTCGHKRKKISE